MLEQTIEQKEQVIIKAESKVEELNGRLEGQATEFRQMLDDMEHVIMKNMEKIQNLELKVP